MDLLLPNLKGDVEVTADRSGIKRLSTGYKNEKKGGRERVLWTIRLNMHFALVSNLSRRCKFRSYDRVCPTVTGSLKAVL